VSLLDSDINRLDDRAAMALPSRFVSGVCDELALHARDLRGAPTTTLIACVEDPDAALVRRYAAGALLALVGDPRIDLQGPAMIDVPGGIAMIGLDPARVTEITTRYAHYGVRREWIAKECPRFSIEIPSFRIGKYPVTNAEYRAFALETDDLPLPTSWPLGAYPVERANHPVYTVTPEAADSYARWLGQRLGRAFRLPREVEWELAAAGADGREFPWGETYAPDRANTVETGILSTSPVGIFPRGVSPFGTYDMGGNVEEFVSDMYWAYPGGEAIIDDLMERGTYRVARGGSFARFADLARCSRRHGHYNRPIYAMGFRLAEDLVAPDPKALTLLADAR